MPSHRPFKRHRILLTILPALLLLLGLASFALWATAASDTASPAAADPPLVGEACASGGMLPLDVICLHGTVWLEPVSGEPIALDDVPVSVSFGGATISGTTFPHSGRLQPTYGLNIAPLGPVYLRPVTITAQLPLGTVERQVTLYPDFETRSQQFDMYVSEIGGLSPAAAVWGTVTSFGTGAAVSGAHVEATLESGATLTATTGWSELTQQTIYAFDDPALTAGALLTLTASYRDDSEQKTVLLGTEPVQLNFVTGWKCADSDPLPHSGSGDALPHSGSGDALPDLACFWGYGFVDGAAAADMQIQIEISGTLYHGVTHPYPNETLPRYGIAVFGAATLSGVPFTITGRYDGVTVIETSVITLDHNLHQRTDIGLLANAIEMHNFARNTSVRDIAQDAEGNLWAATLRGVARWGSDGALTYWTTADGLPENRLTSLALAPNGTVWVVGDSNIPARYDSNINQWIAYPGYIHGGGDASIAVGPDNEVWVSNSYQLAPGLYRFDSNADAFVSFDPSMLFEHIFDLAFDVDGNLWVGAVKHGTSGDGGIGRYNPTTDELDIWTKADHSLLEGGVPSIQPAADGMIWMVFEAGRVGRFDPAAESNAWSIFDPDDSGLGGPLEVVYPAPDGSVLVGSNLNGLYRLFPDTGAWQHYSSDLEYVPTIVPALFVDAEGTAFIDGFGISALDLISDTWTTYPAADMPSHVDAITIAPNGDIWAGWSTGRLFRYSAADQQIDTFYPPGTFDVVESIDAAADGTIWAAMDGGLVQFNPISDTWTVYSTTNSALPSNHVLHVRVAPDQTIWLWAGELVHFDPQSGVWSLTGNTTSGDQGIGFAADGTLWLGGTRGLIHYDPVTEIKLKAAGTNLSGCCAEVSVAPDGAVWYSYIDNIYRFQPGLITPTLGTVEAMPGDGSRAIRFAEDGSVWAANQDRGLVRLRQQPAGWATSTYNQANTGLFHDQVWDIVLTADDTLYIGSNAGMSEMRVPPLLADLGVQLTAPDALIADRPLHLTTAVTNFGQRHAEASMTLTLPADTIVISSTLPPDNSSATAAGWQLGTLEQGQAVTVTLTISPAVSGGWIGRDALNTALEASTMVIESFGNNNRASHTTQLLDPLKADVAIAVSGDPLLIAGAIQTFTLAVQNRGGLAAVNTRIDITLPPSLTTIARSQTLSLLLGTLAADSAPQTVVLPVQVASGSLPPALSLTATITTTTADGDPHNNRTRVSTPTALDDRETLILVPPQRMTQQQGASAVMDRLYALAQHRNVNGVVVDVLRDAEVAAAYAAWDLNPGSTKAANHVTQAIKQLIDTYTITYPNLRYLVLVGGDSILPFHRVPDRNRTRWNEQTYHTHNPGILQGTTTGAALAANQLLTDDFYADRIPSAVDSVVWYDNHKLLLPDFAIGRLIETPADIIAAIDSFLANDGTITLDSSIIGGDRELADDWQATQCGLLSDDAIPNAICTTSDSALTPVLFSGDNSLIATGFHADPTVMGGFNSTLRAQNVATTAATFDNSVWLTIGCHAGLNVGNATLDFAEVVLGRGGTYIGSTAYAYGGRRSVLSGRPLSLYSEALSNQLTDNLLQGDLQIIGEALRAAKHEYFLNKAGTFGFLDEKVLLPMTLYGFPMLRVATPDPTPRAPAAAEPARLTAATDRASVQVVLTDLSYTRYDAHEFGSVFDFMGDFYSEHGRPVQPQHYVPFSATLGAQTIRSVRLVSATYSAPVAFDPIIAEAWLLSEPDLDNPQELPITFSGYDHALPYAIAAFTGLTETLTDDRAGVNFMLGRYDADNGTQIIWEHLAVEVLYSASADTQAPQIEFVQRNNLGNGQQEVVVTVMVEDTAAASSGQLVYDSGGQWVTVALSATQRSNQWSAVIPQEVQHVYVQVFDAGYNAAGEWINLAVPLTIEARPTAAQSSAFDGVLIAALSLLIGFTIPICLYIKEGRR